MPTGPALSRSAQAAASPSRAGHDLSTDTGLLVLVLIWGVNFSVIKVSLAEVTPLAFNALRFPLACVLLAALLRLRGPLPWPAKGDLVPLILLGLLGNVAYQFFFIFGIDATRAGNASLILATTPVWTTAFSTLRGHESPQPAVWGGVLGTVGGMALVVLGGDSALGVEGATLRGDLLLVGASVTWSVYTVGANNFVRTYGSLPVTAWTLWVGTVGLVLAGLPSLLVTPAGEISLMAWGGVVYAGALAIGVAYALWYRGVQRLGNTRTAAYSNLVPLVALLVAWAWLGEVPTLLQMAGAAVIIASVSLARLAGTGRGQVTAKAAGRKRSPMGRWRS